MNAVLLDLLPEVNEALQTGKPVVALESTIIAHGMPYPQNVDTALRVESIVREEGAVPATIAVLEGRLKAGLSREQIDYLGKQGPNVLKASRHDLPMLVARRLNGATTVAATMIIANLAGIRVFATGGIGGVHRGAESTMDVSADLQELARTNVAVVSAGAKAILDLERTLEYLETQGVPVIGYRTTEFPAFYTRHSGLPLQYSVNDLAELARAMQAKWDLGLQGGLLIANPVPETFSMNPDNIHEAIEAAVAEAGEKGIRGKALTPFLLSEIERRTDGASLQANVQLVFNNARVAARLAKTYAGIVGDGGWGMGDGGWVMGDG